MDAVIGTWKMDASRSPGVKEFFLASGTPKEYCTEENMNKSKVTIAKDGKGYNYQAEMPGVPTKMYHFAPGKPFEVETPYGPKFTCTIIEEGGKFHEKMVGDNGQEFTTVREVNGKEMKAVTTYQGQSITTYLVKI